MRVTVIIRVATLLLAAFCSAQQQPRTCRGRVVDQHGKPLAGVKVAVLDRSEFVDSNALLASTDVVTGDDGLWSVHCERPQQQCVMLVCKGRQVCRLAGLGGTPEHETVLVPGGPLAGRVRDSQGRGIAGARIQVVSAFSETLSSLRQVTSGAISDARGIFVVPGVPPTGLRVEVRAEGFCSVSRWVTQGVPADLRMVPAPTARGRIVDEQGQPMEGVDVRIVAVASMRAEHAVTSDADGRFEIEAPTVGPYRVVARATELGAPSISSDVLRGDQPDVVLQAAPGDRTLLAEVSLVERRSKRPIESFRVTLVSTDPTDLQAALRSSRLRRTRHSGSARLFAPEGGNEVRGVLVEADGYAFEVVPLPAEQGGRLVVPMDPENVLTGRVVDAAGKPVANAAVRVVPKGPMFGSGGRAEDAGPLTDVDGRFRVGGLRPGEYGVQVHCPDRPASDVTWTTVVAGDNAPLELDVPERLWLTIDVEGEAPPGPSRQLRVFEMGQMHGKSLAGRFDHRIAPPAPVSLSGPGRLRVGPLGQERVMVLVFVPSRTRTASATTLSFAAAADGWKIRLPDLESVLVCGRVRPSQPLPTERVVVVAHPVSEPQHELAERLSTAPSLAGVRTDGSFELDLPVGSYTFQLVDVETGMVFHTEEHDHVVDERPLTIAPVVRWLEVAAMPEEEGGEVHLTSIGITLSRPRDGDRPAFLRSGSRSNDRQTGWATFYVGETTQRWLVPDGEIRIEARQAVDKLRRAGGGWTSQVVAEATVTIDGPSRRVELKIPALPDDPPRMRRR